MKQKRILQIVSKKLNYLQNRYNDHSIIRHKIANNQKVRFFNPIIRQFTDEYGTISNSKNIGQKFISKDFNNEKYEIIKEYCQFIIDGYCILYDIVNIKNKNEKFTILWFIINAKNRRLRLFKNISRKKFEIIEQ